MIARIIIPILLAIVLPDIYIYMHYWRHYKGYTWWHRLLWWLPSVLMVAYSIAIASTRNFVPDEMMFINVYMMLVGLVVMPKMLFALCSGIGYLVCKYTHRRRNYGNFIWLPFAAGAIYIIMYGFIVGFGKLEVKHLDLYFDDLPEAFEGYRIVHFSDAHVGSFQYDKKSILHRDIDSINAQKADMVVFTGDIQNMQPDELLPVMPLLSKVKAKDGVYSVLGNHDYSIYIDATEDVKKANIKATVDREQQMGWTVLRNDNRVIRRDADSLVIAGEENGGRKPSPKLADLEKSLHGVGKGAFIVMLQHDPNVWQEKIVPDGRVQLTLSGHTHAGQVSVFGLRFTQLTAHNDYGLYNQDRQQLYVTSGLGGVVAMRFGATAEIAVITLHKTK